MLISAMVAGADRIEVTVEADVDGDGNGANGDDGGNTATITIPDEMFTELLVAAAGNNSAAAQQVRPPLTGYALRFTVFSWISQRTAVSRRKHRV